MNAIFQAGGALPADHIAYVERRADRDALRAVLNGEYLHLIAPRQGGKTSLLKHLAAKLGEMGWRCAYVDLSILMDLPKPDWYAELGKALARSLTPEQMPTLSNQIDLRGYLLDQALSYPGHQPYIALFFDEVEGAGKARDADGTFFSDTFFMTLRNLYNQRDDYEGTLVVALAGAVNPSELVKDPDISPFNVGQEINLDDFSPTETKALTENLTRLHLPVEGATHQIIYDWTNGHPYLTQRICAELEKMAHQDGLKVISPENIEHVVEQVILNRVNPLKRDKNIKHVARMLKRLSGPAAKLWSRLKATDIVSLLDASDDTYLGLCLTGAVKADGERLVIRNRIYESAFVETTDTRLSTAVDPKPRSAVMSERTRAFISSTWEDLQPEREAVEKALHRMRDTAFAGMEYFGSRPETPEKVSLAEVDRSDIYIGIFAHRYGSGVTEAEYWRARVRDIPCLIYFKDDNVPVPPAYMERDPEKIIKLEALKRELKKDHTISFFHGSDHLATQIVADLHNLLGTAPSVREKEPSQLSPKYQITITDAQGVVIGDQAQVTQHFASSEVQSQTHKSSSSIGAVRNVDQLRTLANQIGALVVELVQNAPVDSQVNPLWQPSKWRRTDPNYHPTPQMQYLWRRPLAEMLSIRQQEARRLYRSWYYKARAMVASSLPHELPGFEETFTKVQEFIELEVGAPSDSQARNRLISSFKDRFDHQRSILDALEEFVISSQIIQGSWETLIAQVTLRLDTLSAQLGQGVDDLKRGQAALYRQVDRAYRDDLARILAAVQQGRLEQGEIQHILDALRRAMQIVMERGLPMGDELRAAVSDLTEAVESSLSLERKLELSLPLIPTLLAYKIELAVDSEIDLHALWDELRNRVHGLKDK